MAKKIKNPEIIFDFDNEEDLDICGFSDEPIKGTCIATFSCSNNNSNSEIKEAAAEQSNADTISTAKSLSVNPSAPNSNFQVTNYNNVNQTVISTNINKSSKSESNNPIDFPPPTQLSSNANDPLFDNRNLPIVNGCAPPIDGEYLDVKRTYMLRKSTVRKINQLKSLHPDLNTYVSTIVDLAIAHYYEYIINGTNIK